MKTISIIIITLAVVMGAGYLLFTKGNTPLEDKIKNQPGDFSHVPNESELQAGLKNAQLEALSAEGNVLHIHQHLDITINGQNIIVPANIGIATTFISPLHTHDTGGIIHIESPVNKDFTLGQFFTEWGIKFDDSCISTFCTDDSHKIVVGVNSQPVSNPKDYVLKSHDEIHIWYGSSTDNPAFIPNFLFPSGL